MLTAVSFFAWTFGHKVAQAGDDYMFGGVVCSVIALAVTLVEINVVKRVVGSWAIFAHGRPFAALSGRGTRQT